MGSGQHSISEQWIGVFARSAMCYERKNAKGKREKVGKEGEGERSEGK
jgi:hypothetical protein